MGSVALETPKGRWRRSGGSSVSTVLTSAVPPSERPAESLEFQGSVSTRDVGAGLMSAPWTQASHQATVNDPLLREPRP